MNSSPGNIAHHATMTHMSDLVATGAAAKEIGVSGMTLRRWAAAGLVHPVSRTVSGHRRWDIAALRQQVAALAERHDDGLPPTPTTPPTAVVPPPPPPAKRPAAKGPKRLPDEDDPLHS